VLTLKRKNSNVLVVGFVEEEFFVFYFSNAYKQMGEDKKNF
jgi:hypothetical protein